MEKKRFQVVVVGGGPVGTALAVDLGLRGIECALIERHTEPQRLPKGQGLTQRTFEHFYFWGMADDLRASRLVPRDYPIGALTAYGDLTSDYWFVQAGRNAIRPYFFQDNDRLPQYLTEEALRRRLATLPNVTPFWGRMAKGVEQTATGVVVSVTDLGWPYEEYDIEADYVVGCDGAHSPVRRQLGLTESGKDYQQRMVLAVFKSRELHKKLERLPERTTYRVIHPDLEGKWRFFGRVNLGESWFFHAPVPSDATTDSYDFYRLLEESAGFPFECEFTHIGLWDMRIRVADTYRSGRVFIAGDAAHSHPPYAGLGLNTGLEDATNLGWKLAGVLHGWAGDGLLDSYSQERQPIFRETGESVIAGGIERDREFLARYNPEKDKREFEEAWEQLKVSGSWQDAYDPKYEPNYEGSIVVIGPEGGRCTIHGQLTFKAQAGHHLAPQGLSSGKNVFEELGLEHTLLAFDAPEGSVESIAQAASAAGLPLKIVRDSFKDGREAYESKLILVRPDQYVAWCGEEAPQDIASLVARVTGRSLHKTASGSWVSEDH